MAITVTPKTATRELAKVKAGDTVHFTKGVYREKLMLDLNNSGDEGCLKTTLIAEKGVILTQNISADDFRRQANIWADERQRTGKFPSLVLHIKKCFLMLQNSANVKMEGFHFKESWPTHIFIDNCQNIEIYDCDFTDSTFAIAAGGQETYGIDINDCSWRQDPVPGRLWTKIPWWRIHGAEGDGFPAVDIENDWRLFDGDFFRGFDIKGGVTVQHCSVGQAFNAIHLYNQKMVDGLAIDVNVHDCHFFEIRDNVLEAEKGAANWWFWHNTVKNAHKPLSLEIRKGGGAYIFGNRIWFDSIQGPAGFDANRGGGMFKFDKKSKNKEIIPSYVFHNSFFLRADYMRKGQLEGLTHFNNAIKFAEPGISDEEDKFVEDLPEVFGNLSASADIDISMRYRFTDEWTEKGISFENDVIDHECWPNILMKNGYSAIASLSGRDPKFKGKYRGDFELEEDSPCQKASKSKGIKLVNGDDWNLQGGQDVGAMQDEKLIVGPKFTRIEA